MLRTDQQLTYYFPGSSYTDDYLNPQKVHFPEHQKTDLLDIQVSNEIRENEKLPRFH